MGDVGSVYHADFLQFNLLLANILEQSNLFGIVMGKPLSRLPLRFGYDVPQGEEAKTLATNLLSFGNVVWKCI
jgi:hypothetical protein